LRKTAPTFILFPILNYIVPGQVLPLSEYRRKLGFLGRQKEAAVLETDDIPRLWIPPFKKLRMARTGEHNSVGSLHLHVSY